jgi:hypothetical protein
VTPKVGSPILVRTRVLLRVEVFGPTSFFRVTSDFFSPAGGWPRRRCRFRSFEYDQAGRKVEVS